MFGEEIIVGLKLKQLIHVRLFLIPVQTVYNSSKELLAAVMGSPDKNAGFITMTAEEPKLVRPKHMGRYIIMMSVLCLTTFYCGYCLAYITALGSENLAIVYGEVTKLPVLKAFLISSVPWGVCIGTFLNPYILPKASRRNLTLILCFIAELLEFFIQVQVLTVFFIVRVLQGVVTGLFLALIPIYVRQLSPKQISKRGVFGIFGQLFVILGFMMAFGINTILLQAGVDQKLRWRLVISLNFFAILIIIVSIVTKIIPQSPNSLIPKGKIQDAKNAIALFHRENVVEEVYQQKVKQIEDAKKPPAPPSKDRHWSNTVLAFQVPMMHQFTGINAYISQMGFVTAIFDNKFGNYVPFMMGAIQVITALYALTYLKRMNRKKLILIGNCGMSLCCIGIGISYIFTSTYGNTFWIIVILIIIFMGLNGATLVPAVGVYVPQVATRVQARWSGVTNWLACAVSVVSFITVGQYFGYQYIFLAFGFITMACFVFNAAFMIDTKPKLKQIVNMELVKINMNESIYDEKETNRPL